MVKPTNKELILDAAIQLIAENGLISFSMRQVTKKIGICDSLIYRHYETKDNLLLQCYLRIDEKINALLKDEKFVVIRSEKELQEYIHHLWLRYFWFLIEHEEETLFYFEYRDSKFYKTARENGDIKLPAYLRLFSNALRKVSGVPAEKHSDYEFLWPSFLDITGVFAKKVIRGEIPNDSENDEMIWKVLWSGLSFLEAGKSFL